MPQVQPSCQRMINLSLTLFTASSAVCLSASASLFHASILALTPFISFSAFSASLRLSLLCIVYRFLQHRNVGHSTKNRAFSRCGLCLFCADVSAHFPSFFPYNSAWVKFGFCCLGLAAHRGHFAQCVFCCLLFRTFTFLYPFVCFSLQAL